MLTEAGLWKIDLASPHQLYFSAARKRLPGVTTVQSVFDKPALKRWGLGLERDGILDAIRNALAKYDDSSGGYFRDIIINTLEALPPNNDKGEPTYFCESFTQRAADIGTIGHARCEAFLHGTTLDETGLDAEMIAKSANAFGRFRDWWHMERLTVVHSEVQLVSERDQVGGTIDIVARAPGGALVLADLKTSKASRYWPYPEVFGQTAQYASMYEEVHGEKIGRIVVVRTGKEADDAGQQHWLTEAQRAAGKRLFDAARIAYEVRKELSRG